MFCMLINFKLDFIEGKSIWLKLTTTKNMAKFASNSTKSKTGKETKALAKATATIKASPPKGLTTPVTVDLKKASQVSPGKITPTKNPYDSQKKHGKLLIPKNKPKADEEKIHKIFIFNNPDGSAYGWGFFGFYDCKEFLKSLTNKNGAHTYYGDEEFKSFSNLTMKWVTNAKFHKNLWVIRIEKTKNQDDVSFPVKAHKAFANKNCSSCGKSRSLGGTTCRCDLGVS